MLFDLLKAHSQPNINYPLYLNYSSSSDRNIRIMIQKQLVFQKIQYNIFVILNLSVSEKMGNCAPATRTSIYLSKPAQALYTSVLKCPNNHWLAFYATDTCSHCSKNNSSFKSIKNHAIISCVNCEYALCDLCFSAKFTNWEKKAQKLQSEEAQKFLQALRRDISQFGKENGFIEIEECKRLADFLDMQHRNCRQLRAGKKPEIRTSLQIRVEKVAKLCEKVYQKKANSSIQ